MTTGPILRRAVLPALFAAVLPAALAGQSLAYAASAAPPSVERAEALHAEADRLAQATGDLGEGRMRRVAGLYARAAAHFAPDDPRGVASLRDAAALLHRFDPERAARLLERAADRALARGDVLTAAHVSLDLAALVATRAREGRPLNDEWVPRARERADRALLLASSPLLSDADRAGIQRRVR